MNETMIFSVLYDCYDGSRRTICDSLPAAIRGYLECKELDARDEVDRTPTNPRIERLLIRDLFAGKENWVQVLPPLV